MVSFLLILSIFFPLASSSSSFSFSFPSFSPNEANIIFSDGAAVSNGSLRLTDGRLIRSGNASSSTSSPVGASSRAYFKQPVQIWRRDTDSTTSFTSYFEFSISFPNASSNDSSSSPAGGFIFFLAPESVAAASPGGNQTVNLLAVEFDSYRSSNATGASQGDTLAARVSYNSSSKSILVSVGKPRQLPAPSPPPAANGTNSSSSSLSLTHVVNLQQFLPENVMVGFSSVTDGSAVVQRITRWNFTVDELPGPPGPFKTWYLGPIIALPLLVSMLFALYFFGGEDVKVHMLSVLLSPLILCVYLGSICKCKPKAKLDEAHMEDELAISTNPRRINYRALASATGNFSEKRKLGQGGFGVVYRGVLQPSGEEVAVKKISSGSKQGRKEYESEVRIISRLRHRNLVRLIGWCHDRSDFLLVYEYLPNGSLDHHLFNKKRPPLPWKLRYGVAVGLASALLYLHEEWEQCVVHRDIKSSNVMLDSEFNAKLGDFGLARLVDHKLGQQTTLPAGTLGYLAPECVLNAKASKESDVYSFGVVALEIATGRRAVEMLQGGGLGGEVRVLERVWDLNGAGRLLEAADPALGEDFEAKQMETLLLTGLWCAHPDQGQRPTMRLVIQALTADGKIPAIPKTMPVPVFADPPLEILNSDPPSANYSSILTGR